MSAPPGRLRSVALLGGGTVLAALFGLGFQALLSYHFGAGAETDAWFMSLSIYAFLGKFLMLTNVKSLALPVYRRLQTQDPAAAVRLERRLLFWLGGVTGVLSVLLVVAAPVVVDVLAPGYEGVQRALTVTLVRIRTPALAFLAMSTGGLVALEAAHRFGVTVAAQKVVPAGVTLILFLLVADRLGMVGVGWVGLAGGVAGGLVALVAMAPLLRVRREETSPEAHRLASTELRSIGGQWARFSGSNGATFVGEWAFRVAASLLPVGLFSAVLYGRMVHDLLHAAVNDSAQTVSLPRFAAAAAEEPVSTGEGEASPGSHDEHGLRSDPAFRVGGHLREGLGMLASVTVPLAAFTALTAPWTVALLFGRGRFLADGMLGPAALSLRIFAVAFLVQGLNQLLFSAAFASGRSYLVNRVQIVGHLVRAAVLVPAVMAFSYVGLIGAQVAMNLLILTLLVVFAPAAWGLRRTAALQALLGATGRGTVVATAVAAGLHLVLALRFPEPLAVGTVARGAVLLLAAGGWLVVYGGVAWLLGVPSVRRGVARLRVRGVGSLAVLAVLAAVVSPGAAVGQAVDRGDPSPAPGAALLPASHWSRGVLEILEAQGSVPVGAASAGPLPGARVDRLLAGAPPRWRDAVTSAFRREVAGVGPWGGAADAEAGVSAVDDLPGEEGGAFAAARLRLGTGESPFFARAHVDAGPGAGRHSLLAGSVGARLGPLALQAGRERVQLGGGATGSLVLSGTVPLDGVLLTTVEPFRVGFLGSTSITAGVFPMGRYEAVDDPWFALLRVAAAPTSWLQVGMSRAALVGGSFPGGSVPWDPVTYGPDTSSLSPGDLLGMLVGRVTGFDNQVGAFDVRASLAPLGAPVLVYGEIGLEDKDRSWGDAAVMAGVLVAPRTEFPVALRYEYTAFGDPARWCAWCDTLPAYWYQHARFQSGWQVEGELLGHPLGGYGLQHTVGVTVFDPGFRFFTEVLAGRLRRDEWNLLESDRPGWATWVEARLRYRTAQGVEIRAEGRTERGAAGWSVGRMRVALGYLLPR